jgi:hypothetical protein
MRFFASDFFFEPRPDFTAKNMPKIAEMKLSSCGLKVADIRKNCDCGVAEQYFFKKLRNCDCGLKKKLRVPTSAFLVAFLITNMYICIQLKIAC